MKQIHPKFAFRQRSTPIISFSLPEGVDGAGYRFTVTFAQSFQTVLSLLTPSDQLWIEDGMLYVGLTAEDTGLFRVGDVDAQIHYESSDGAVASSSREIYGLVLRTQEVT